MSADSVSAAVGSLSYKTILNGYTQGRKLLVRTTSNHRCCSNLPHCFCHHASTLSNWCISPPRWSSELLPGRTNRISTWWKRLSLLMLCMMKIAPLFHCWSPCQSRWQRQGQLLLSDRMRGRGAVATAPDEIKNQSAIRRPAVRQCRRCLCQCELWRCSLIYIHSYAPDIEI